MNLRPFFCYYGGKWRAALSYPKPRYPLIIEPFAGAAGYSTRYPGHLVTIADLDPIIVRVWRWLASATPADVLSLPLLDADQDVRDLPIPEGARDLIAFWLNKGCTRPRRRPSKWMRDGLRPGSFWGPTVRSRIAEQVGSIGHWQVLNNSWESLPDVEATWFIDPPYRGRPGSHYSFGSKLIDYDRLAEFCRTRRGQVIVCEAAGADWLPFQYLGTFKLTLAEKYPEKLCGSTKSQRSAV